jgi:hypothetical protein
MIFVLAPRGNPVRVGRPVNGRCIQAERMREATKQKLIDRGSRRQRRFSARTGDGLIPPNPLTIHS